MDRISISLNRNDMKIISATEHFVILGEIVVRVVVVVVVDDAGGISKKNKTSTWTCHQKKNACTTPDYMYYSKVCVWYMYRTCLQDYKCSEHILIYRHIYMHIYIQLHNDNK